MPTIDIATRAHVVALRSYGVKAAETQEWTNINARTQRNIYSCAIKCGFDPSQPVLSKHVIDEPRSGRLSKINAEKRQEVLNTVRKDQYRWEKTYAMIADKVNLSDMTIWRILWRAGYRKTKLIRKPDLIEKMKKKRLVWYLTHKD